MSFQKAFTRRSFLAGLGVAGAASWLHDSDHIAARSLRSAVADGDRAVAQPPKPDWRSWSERDITVSWLGHATVLIDFYGMKVLTDPVLMDWVGLDLGFATVGEKRVVAPALKVAELPPLDLVLISHAHMDHLDLGSLEALPKGPQVITAPATTDLVRGAGHRRVEELKWGQETEVVRAGECLKVQALEVKHWGARWKSDDHRGYNGYALERNGRTLVFGGDTAQCEHFRGLRQRKPVAAIMPVGSYGRGSKSHCTPEEAVGMVNDARADFMIPVHHSTFPLGKEPMAEPLERTVAAIAGERLAIREVGGEWRFRS